MRRWLAILLLLFMPLQLTWAAASVYCQHESGIGSWHLGHHEHQHETHQTTVDADVSPDPVQPVQADDAGCLACHAGCVSALTSVATLAVAPLSSHAEADYHIHFAPPPSERIDRPRWFALA